MRRKEISSVRRFRLLVLSRARAAWVLGLLATLGIAAAVALAGVPRTGRAADPAARHGGRGSMPMSEAAMRAHAEAWWASHSPVGASPEGPAASEAVATFTVNNFYFDRDGNPGTQVDTATISVGESVMWQWVAGFHTITSGAGSGDPNAGTLFNQPSDTGHQQFTFQFNDPGTFPFFCMFHELSDMRGVVIVTAPAGVEPLSRGEGLGFAGEPAPNPTAAGTRFRFAMRRAGRVRAEVFDATGRRVAVVLDRYLESGVHTAAWDGRTGTVLADPGVYYLRLRLPGFEGNRTLIVRR